MYPNRPRATLIALDQLVGALITGWPDATISAWAWVWEREGKCSWLRKLIDRLFWRDKDHCELSYRNERRGAQLPPEMRRK